MFLTNFSLLRSFFSTSPFLVSFRDRKIFVRSPFFDFLFSSVVNFPAQFDLRCMFDHVWLRGSLCKLCVIIGACLRVDCLCFTPPSPPPHLCSSNSNGKTTKVESTTDSRSSERDRVPESRCGRTSLPFCVCVIFPGG